MPSLKSHMEIGRLVHSAFHVHIIIEIGRQCMHTKDQVTMNQAPTHTFTHLSFSPFSSQISFICLRPWGLSDYNKGMLPRLQCIFHDRNIPPNYMVPGVPPRVCPSRPLRQEATPSPPETGSHPSCIESPDKKRVATVSGWATSHNMLIWEYL